MNCLYHKVVNSRDLLLIVRMKHSHIIYNEITKSLLIDNSLKKELELVERRRKRNKDNKDNKDNIQVIEMSESHVVQPYIKNKLKNK